ncbi:hypothetical protein [Yoonia sediminilitoris]|uniref:Uncharacterized protein n=1 Tax=Yoonia sediminilitoris TaxID=1286148 RepID=A0A2T6KRL3_9RHOB|nr:hypothetical protein [Yoonia sediminilitoris]PUB19206.1 hypothetical protein C8N45_101799 [Yoonia sediminilitoris]RCW99374.1 hypothetical protein DFP92_101799 [Yoonia sediminilitoris]
MENNDRLAKLIFDQVQGQSLDRDAEIDQMLRDALRTAQSRLDLRDRIFDEIRKTNQITTDDVAEAMGETFADLIRDLEDDIGNAEQNMLPSRFMLSTSIAGMIGALTAFVYGVADAPTALGAFGLASVIFFLTHTYYQRMGRLISDLRKRRADYAAFRDLLRRRL